LTRLSTSQSHFKSPVKIIRGKADSDPNRPVSHGSQSPRIKSWVDPLIVQIIYSLWLYTLDSVRWIGGISRYGSNWK
jgi:hypothetical protein